ncbi:hypothetical protein [Thermococcus sp.]|uniref:hypothetical protein n=1 Tax=Thermococcus sp. TaxID=35749 RepID=UPI002613C357|nr:hypothetical protein [Thermococcus sp.]
MRRVLGFMMVVILLSWSVATVHPVRAEPVTNEAYQAFWDILNREAWLYAQIEGGNSSAVEKFIDNSRLGSENAINISTLIWQSLRELKSSGVKLYYTADELRQMAENVSENGLPNETVEELKAQGWTDDQIKALEEYIAKNADNITGDFNMSAFLQNFSTAFMRVAFKYNHYWAYGLEKLLNRNASSLDVPVVVITQSPEARNVPIAWDAFENFTGLYKNADLATKLSLVRKLENKIIDMGQSSGWRTLYSKKNFLSGSSTSCQLTKDPALLGNLFRNASITSKRLLNQTYSVPVGSLPSGSAGYYYETLAVRSFVSGDYIIVELRRKWESQKVLNDCSIQTISGENYTIYYWRAFEALEALKNLESTLEAVEKGNGNPDLRELEANLTDSLPGLFKTEKIGHYWRGSTTIIHRSIPGDPQPPAVEGTSSSEAFLDLGVEVSAADVTENYATYRVTVALQAVGGSVSDVDVSVNGDGLSDSKHYNVITPSDGVVRWTTRASSKIYGSGSVNVSGTVDVYYSVPYATPTSIGLPGDAGTVDSNDRKHVNKEYSETIRLGTPIKPGKVTFKIIPSDSTVRPGSNVTFKVEVINNNDKPINAEYTLDVAYPLDGESATASFSNSTIVQKGDPWVDVAGRVYYASTGTFHYSGVLKFEGFSKTVEGDIVVSSNANSSGSDPAPSNGRLTIVSVTPEPEYPKEGDTVGFNVKIGSTYPSTERALVKLYVDGELKDSKPLNVTTSGVSVTLHWLAKAGEHDYTVKLYRLVNDQELWEDSIEGTVNVTRDSVEIVKVECPERVGLGETVTCRIYLKNNLGERVSINTKDVFLYGHPYDEYLHQSRTVKIEYPIQNSINIDPNHTEVLLVAPIKIPEDKTLLNYQYVYDPHVGDGTFDWTDTNYTLSIQIDMPYPQKDVTINKTITLYYFGSQLMQEDSKKFAYALIDGFLVPGVSAYIALFMGLGPIGTAIVGGIVLTVAVYIEIRN